MEQMISRVHELVTKHKSIVIAVSEGIRMADGHFVCELSASSAATDAFGHKMMQGAGKYLADIIHERLGIKTRAIELNTLQRCASHSASATDINEAFQVGAAAMHAASEGNTGLVVTLKRLPGASYQCVTDLSDVHEIANVEKKVPKEWITEDGTAVSEKMLSYLRPLIQGELYPVMVDGLPRHLVLKR